jgi:hypothetical protein
MNISVLCRQSDGDQEQCGLVLGVFATPEDAMVHATTKEHLPIEAWTPPRPGKRRWMLPSNDFVFVIEEYPLHDAGALSATPDLSNVTG